MANQPLSPSGLKLELEERINETVVHCQGKITAENQREITAYLQNLDRSMRAFLTLSEKMRKGSANNSAAPPAGGPPK